MEADSPPSDWEIRAVIREHLVAQSDVTAWFNANANGLRVVEHNVVLTPKPLSVTVDITDTRPDGPVSCQKYRVLFDMHIYDVDENTANANRALALIERALREHKQ